MGVIKEGKVSGTLPDDESFAVHFPGYPKTTARAIETLGGTEGILKVILYSYSLIFEVSMMINRGNRIRFDLPEFKL